MNRQKLGADLSLLAVAFVWGTTFVIIQNAISTLPPFTFNTVRFSLAGISLLALLLIKEKGRIQLNPRSLLPGLLLGFFLFLGYAFQTFGLLFTTPAKAGFITGLSVILVPFLGILLLKQRPLSASITGAISACFGLYLLASGHAQSVNFGDLLVMVCALGFAFHIIFTDKYAKTISALQLTVIQIMTVAVLSFLSMLFFEDWQSSLSLDTLLQMNVLSALIVTALLATSAAYFIQTSAQKYTTPARVAVILTMEPVFAALSSYLWIGEELTGLALVGCLFIFMGMLVTELPGLIRFATKKSHKEA
ncbi:DMT family transporter [Rossellomorea vietnamensis]|uniref:DMT family transporter n=1 Tax=Rossellomorea vietnamensis TaxID=218284 RepID=A0A5D4MJ62_9BACI|nr:DMT family transporter [Rossellomorea vietnamensis]TYS01662.1 DMT family transporter [Rossellomorea vietnamensis]